MAHLVTRGTFYDVGYNVGLAFSSTIRNFFDDCESQMMVFYDSPHGRAVYEESLQACQTSYPQYIKELRGLADGAGMPFEHVFMANVFERAVLPTDIHLPTSEKTGTLVTNNLSSDAIGCTALFLIDKNDHRYILHNEDAWSECKGGYLLTAEIEEDGFERESFTSFCYPGSLPNWAFGFNHHGMTFCVNAQLPLELINAAPSVKFVMRSLVRARDVPDAIRLAKNAPHGVGYGFTVNLSTKDGQMTSVEVGPAMPEGKIHVKHVAKAGETTPAPCHYYHFNAFKHIDVQEVSNLFSSTRREERCRAIPPPHNLQAALQVLADSEDCQAPIFRTPRPSDLLETVCSVLFDVTGRQMWLYQGRDDLLANKPLLKLPLP